jgi:hypothetical protein
MENRIRHWTAKRQFGRERPESTGAEMSIQQTVAEILREHVTLGVEGIGRTYLNMYRWRCNVRAQWRVSSAFIAAISLHPAR